MVGSALEGAGRRAETPSSRRVVVAPATQGSSAGRDEGGGARVFHPSRLRGLPAARDRRAPPSGHVASGPPSPQADPSFPLREESVDLLLLVGIVRCILVGFIIARRILILLPH